MSSDEPRLRLPQVYKMDELEGDGVSIIIPCYEESWKLKRTLWSIEQNADLPYQLIVAEARQSVAKNRNMGLKDARHDVVCMLDDDVLLPPFFLSKLVLGLAFNKEIGVVSAKMTNPDGTAQNGTIQVPDHAMIEMVPPGTCFVYSRSRAEGCEFDERYVASQWEDTDFMAQVRSKGLKTVVTGECHIIHDNNWTGHTNDTWKKNRDLFVSKWPELSEELGIAA